MVNSIEIEHVSKIYKKHSEPTKTLKDKVFSFRDNKTEKFLALDAVHFSVSVGETIGILGHNGSGKSTLLKCIAGTIRPTSGVVRVRGRLSALLELGAGFHPDLTGRENVYLNGSILGFTKQRIDQIFDEIVAFAELEDFIDSQVKHYSSGMYARLGFAVAVNLEPDVLLVDEVLAVGDEAFQRKCIERVRGFQLEGRTILLVTHAPELVRQLCDRSVVLDHGKMLHVGDVSEGVAVYRRSLANRGIEVPDDPAEAETEGPAVPTKDTVAIQRVWVEPPPDGRSAHQPGDRVSVGLRYRASEEVQGLRGRFILHSHDGILLANISTLDIRGSDIALSAESSEEEIVFTINDLPLMDGRYFVTLLLQDQTETFEYARSEQEIAFDVSSGGPVTGRVAFDMAVTATAKVPWES